MPLMAFTLGESRRSAEKMKARNQKKQERDRNKRKLTGSNPPTYWNSWWRSDPKSQRGWHEAPKAPEPSPAAVAANLGVRPLALADHCPPPVARDTACHAISEDPMLAETIYSFGRFAATTADTLQAELAQRLWHEVSQGSEAERQELQPMYVPNVNALPDFLPSLWGLE